MAKIGKTKGLVLVKVVRISSSNHFLFSLFVLEIFNTGILLTRTRLATSALIDFIQTTPILEDLPRPINPVRLVGQGESDNHFMTESEQKTALRKFREGKYGCDGSAKIYGIIVLDLSANSSEINVLVQW